MLVKKIKQDAEDLIVYKKKVLSIGKKIKINFQNINLWV